MNADFDFAHMTDEQLRDRFYTLTDLIDQGGLVRDLRVHENELSSIEAEQTRRRSTPDENARLFARDQAIRSYGTVVVRAFEKGVALRFSNDNEMLEIKVIGPFTTVFAEGKTFDEVCEEAVKYIDMVGK